ncbi:MULTISPECIES: hypothetical protein [unclassified Frankia]|uniref:hypothetical protein n=1 Tax=unclassified Frankia TaxID=2632575 RepID=UPI002AD4AF00|nr:MULTISPECIES: hypothetical protein [unclassified Frankia]
MWPDLVWVEAGREVRRPLMSVATVAFEEVSPVREFPSYRGQRHFPGLYYSGACRNTSVTLRE